MKPNLAFFLELGGSFEEWNEVGFFSREIALYNQLAKNFFGTIYIFTYGSSTDLEYSAYLEKNIVVVPRGKRSKSYFNNFFYEISLPFQHRNILKRCDIFKTNQNSGSFGAVLTKTLFPMKKLVIRSGYIGSELARRSGLSILVRTYYLFAERLSYWLCDHAFIPLRENKDILIRKYPFLKNKLSQMNNFIDTKVFSPETKEKTYDIIYVARFDRDKNHRLLIRALRKTSFRLLLIGKGPERKSIERLASTCSVNLSIIDSVPNSTLREYYNAAHICAFPSLHEGCPKTLLEAMACGIPPVTLNSPGISEIIQNNQNGLTGKADSFQKNVMRLLSDASLRDILGKSARETVLREYSFEKIVQQEIETYKALLATRV